MVHPEDRMLYAFLACTLTFRDNSTHKVTKEGLFLLWCINTGRAISTAGWFMYRIHKTALKDKGDIVIGGYVTWIAEYFQIVLGDDDEDHKIPFSEQHHCIGAKVLEGAIVVKKLKELDKYGRVKYRVIRPGEQPAEGEQAQERGPTEPIRFKRHRGGSSRQGSGVEANMTEIVIMMRQMNTGMEGMETRLTGNI